MRIEIRQLLQRGAHINIIGDSLAAGAGSSGSWKTDKELFFVTEKKIYEEGLLQTAGGAVLKPI